MEVRDGPVRAAPLHPGRFCEQAAGAVGADGGYGKPQVRGRFGHRQVVAVHVLDGTGWVEPGSGSCELQRWRCSFAVGDSCGQGGYRG